MATKTLKEYCREEYNTNTRVLVLKSIEIKYFPEDRGFNCPEDFNVFLPLKGFLKLI